MLPEDTQDPEDYTGQALKDTPLVHYLAKYPNISYSVTSGRFWRVNIRNQSIMHEVIPDPDNSMMRVTTPDKTSSSKAASSLGWELANGKDIPEGHVVYFKNMNSKDFRGYNLGVVTRKDARRLRDAVLNSGELLKLIPHPTEAFSYKVRCRVDGFVRVLNFHDIIAAKRFIRIVQIKSTKLMNKYLITE
jgi:HNH endonuclease